MDELQIRRDSMHYMMQAAFIEIRAAESLNAAHKFADVFHNLPMGLLGCSTLADYDAEFAKLMGRAKRWNLDGYLQKLSHLAIDVVGRGE